jgi:hypothetical protein
MPTTPTAKTPFHGETLDILRARPEDKHATANQGPLEP